jgi:hypothetical protein
MQPRNRNYWEAKSRVSEIDSSNLCISQNDHRPKIGQLLVGAYVISPELLNECIDESRLSQRKLGDVLVELGKVPQREVRSALLAQSLISDGVLGESTAVRMLARASASQSELVDVISRDALEQDFEVDPDQVGLAEMLIDANFVSGTVIDEVLKRSAVSGVLLGRALLLMNVVTIDLLDATFLVMGLVRDMKLSRADGIRVLKETKRGNSTADEAIDSLKIGPKRRQKSVTLGRICVQAKLINEFECLAALERALTDQIHLGDELVASGLIAEKPLRIALLLQGLAQLGVISLEKSVLALQTMQQNVDLSFNQVAADMKLFAEESADDKSIVLMLRTASIVSKEDIQTATDKFATYQMCTTKALLAAGILELSTYKICLSCSDAIKDRQFGLLDAAKLLQISQKFGFDYFESYQYMLVQKRQAQTKTKAPAKVDDKSNNFSAQIKVLLSVPEYKQLLLVLPFLAIAAISVRLWFPTSLTFWGYWGVFFLLAAVLFRTGHARTSREALLEEQKNDRVVQAKEMQSRLTRKKA